ncbi:AbrB family transcriptional regulator [Thalassospira sp. NFXS8]|uniref:AbrB family transcriptional regulator n=1 Tax=Thalassospira sp. NFXS8 TaxID=2819093 RepID=UPI0032DFCF03
MTLPHDLPDITPKSSPSANSPQGDPSSSSYQNANTENDANDNKTGNNIPLDKSPIRRLGKLPEALQWAILLGSSVIVGIILHQGHIPAALLLGPMIVGIVMGTNSATIRIPRIGFLSAQSVLGAMIGGSMTAAIITSFLDDWPLVIGITFLTLLASSFLGWILCIRRVLPGTVGIWGSSPGAASAMVIMAEAFGADARLVAFMQYVRVVCVVTVASMVANFWVASSLPPGAAVPVHDWFPAFDLGNFGLTLLVAAAAATIGVLLRIPSGALLVPMIVVMVLHINGWLDVELPEWFLGITYAMIGWSIGLKFTPSVLHHAAHALPKILLSIVVLIGFCAGISVFLVHFLGVDPLTAYLATSPGGLDSVAIIAASTHVDLPFILVMQSARFFMVLLIGPPLAKAVARFTPTS